jgi:single-stranded-DNA-specific exonuclease
MIVPNPAPHWVPHPRRDAARARGLAGELDIPVPAAEVLVNRGVGQPDAARRFMAPSLDDLHDPWLLRDLDRAVERIERALAQGERIFLHGDYDVDGITSAFLLGSVLRDLGGQVRVRIPKRTGGFGLSPAAVEEARARHGCSLVVTVDCGVTQVQAVEYANSVGLDTIITDHHAPPAVLPPAHAIVNPWREGCRYPFKALAGVGVTYKLVEALLGRRGRHEEAREYLDVVALGTIADVVPLVGENRVLAHFGLERLNHTGRVGLKALMEVAGLSGRRVGSGHVAFVLAPRINAAGRMGDGRDALLLLKARDRGEALALAQSLEEDNQRRRQFDEEALEQASQRVSTELGWPDCSSILLWSDEWHKGVIGIVASRLVDRFQRPAVLVSFKGDASGAGDDRGRGSGRSIEGVHLSEVLAECGDLLEAHGGHALAAGFTVRRDRLPELRQRLEAAVAGRLSAESLQPRLVYDAEVALAECDMRLVEVLEQLEPHGRLGNPEPVFRIADLKVIGATTVSQGRHLKLQVRDGSGTAEVIGFGLGARCREVKQAGTCSLALVPTRNEWMGESRVQLKIHSEGQARGLRVGPGEDER